MSELYETLRRARIELIVRLPGEVVGIPLDIGSIVSDCLRPLPRDRELPWAIPEQEIAQQMQMERRDLAHAIAERLAGELITAFGGRDTINGYSRDEHRAFYQATTPTKENDA